MKSIKLILTLFIGTIFFSCTTGTKDDDSTNEIASNAILDLKEVSRWNDGGGTDWVVEENRVERTSNDFSFIVKQFNPETKNDYILEQALTLNVYQLGEKGTVEVDHIWRESPGVIQKRNTYKILNSRIEDKDIETMGALILTLEATNKTDKLEIMFIDKGVDGLVSSDKCLVQISGQQTDLSTQPNQNNFYLCFSTKQSFKIVGKTIVVN